jgi:hypothetical protein
MADKEYKIWVKTTDIITVPAKNAEEALEKFRSSLTTQVAPIEYGVLEEEE